MRKGSDLIGLPVIAFDTGSRVEKVEDVVFDQDSNRVLGVIVDDGGWLRSARVVPFSDLQAIGPDAVIVQSAAVVRGSDETAEMRPVLERGNVLKGTRIMTTDGRDLGTMTDIFFDEGTGALEGYEVSGGMFTDAYTGRSFVPAPKTVKIGHDVAFVEPEVLQLMQEQVGGIRGAMEEAGTRTSAWTDAVKTRMGGEIAERSVEQARGRRLQATIVTEHRIVIGAAGQIVTDAVIARARAYGKEDALLEAAGLTPMQAAGSNARDGVGSAAARIETAAANVRERLHDGSKQAREGSAQLTERVAGAWQRVKDRVETRQEELAREREVRRIHDAVGLPVTRVILDRDDHVLLNTGELITNQAVERARQSGVLDVLLDAAYHPKPEFSKDELRAPEPGEASLGRRH